jgi:hypothetical protein
MAYARHVAMKVATLTAGAIYVSRPAEGFEKGQECPAAAAGVSRARRARRPRLRRLAHVPAGRKLRYAFILPIRLPCCCINVTTGGRGCWCSRLFPPGYEDGWGHIEVASSPRGGK